MKYAILAMGIIVLCTVQIAYAAEQIPISKSGLMDNVIWNGKWTFYEEWKESSLYTLSYDDGTVMQLRAAHEGNFIYVLIDAISMTHYNQGSDRAIICFDGKDDKNKIADDDDYCFGVALGNNNPFVLRGGSPLEQTYHFTNIANSGVIGVAGISDENDHYSSIPHSNYEFRIPIDLLGRADVYGFYLGVYDSHKEKIYAFPENLTSSSKFGIPSPSQWGEIVSPDKSLPEFPLPVIALLGAFVLVIFITRKAYSFKNH
ncbi:MAG: hypothetical protein ACREAN_01020 [Nitrosopumilaceae archaeon]